LWQRDQKELLSEMIGLGMEAILIKVAGIGLRVDHLGKTLAEMQPTLVKLVGLMYVVGCLVIKFPPRMTSMDLMSVARAESTRL
jgi:hypothetical protein